MSRRPARSRRDPGRYPAKRISRAALMLAAVLGLAPGIASAQTAEDSVAVRSWIDAYVAAWNSHDAVALAEFFADDAYMVMGNLPALRGRAAIRDDWKAYFDRQEPGRRLTLDVRSLRFTAPDVAVIHVGTTTGGRDGEGGALRGRRFRGGWVVQRTDGAWRVASMVGVPTEEDRVVLGESMDAAERLRPGIRAFVDAYEDAFNRHDPAALTAFYGDDADLVIRDGPVIHGRAAILEWWQRYFAEPRSYRALFIPETVRMLTPDVALVDLVVTGATAEAAAGPAPVRYARATWLAVRAEGRWRLAAVWVLLSEDDRLIREGIGYSGDNLRGGPPPCPAAGVLAGRAVRHVTLLRRGRHAPRGVRGPHPAAARLPVGHRVPGGVGWRPPGAAARRVPRHSDAAHRIRERVRVRRAAKTDERTLAPGYARDLERREAGTPPRPASQRDGAVHGRRQGVRARRASTCALPNWRTQVYPYSAPPRTAAVLRHAAVPSPWVVPPTRRSS